MNPGTRVCIAYVAGRIISGRKRGHIYDFGRSKFILFSGSVDDKKANVYDHDRGCHFSGTLPSLYDFGGSHHVSIKIDGSRFSGYDFGASHHFNGTVRNATVSVYDFGASSFFTYSI
ncbi:hypothetical protein [Paraburkholderia sediminicola]|uniref:hypothetical protein n=1 Tax=Paraburkholderia sediminicola TaxID=458836 RepID=UPI0038B70A03